MGGASCCSRGVLLGEPLWLQEMRRREPDGNLRGLGIVRQDRRPVALFFGAVGEDDFDLR